MSQTTSKPIEIAIANHILTTKSSASCLGVKWCSDLSARDSVNTNILKARKAFFGLGSTGVYHGKLNPLSSSSIFESFVLPVLLYGCETWMLDATCIQALDRFQCEIGRRILKLSKRHPSDAVRIALNWPTISTRILLRKLTFLSRLLTNSDDTMSSRIFTSLAIVDVYSITIVQQCRLLEAPLGTNIIYKCLENAENAMITVRSNKKNFFSIETLSYCYYQERHHFQFNRLPTLHRKSHGKNCGTMLLIMAIRAQSVSILCELCRPTFGDRLCHLCSGHVECFSIHLCTDHPSLVCHHSLSTIIDNIISNVDMPFIITLGSSLCHITA